MLPLTLSQLADRLVLSPTRSTLFAYGKSPHLIPWQEGAIEVWTEQTHDTEPEWFVLKFHGKCGRAERSNLHPLDHWSDLPGEVWSVYPTGYGGSSGRARLRSLIPAAECAFQELLTVAAGRPIVLAAHSLGTASALYLAARHGERENIAGLVLHNPPPLKRLIQGKYAWPSLGLSRILATQVPRELDSIAHAAQVRIPAVFIASGRDRMVPPRFQRPILDAYAGPKQVIELPNCGHEVRFSRAERQQYGRALDWLRQRMDCRHEPLLLSDAS
ncbi:MAG: hypothetical protein SFU86_24380 [Pirellulaceae bacterium]|nr:hypothetical protein [Pirellulaceae bacterium]